MKIFRPLLSSFTTLSLFSSSLTTNAAFSSSSNTDPSKPSTAKTSTTNTCQAATSTSDNENIDTMTKFRSVRKIMPRPSCHWVGDGFHVYPVFANLAFTPELSPLLMFDYAEPKKFDAKVGKPRGVGQHPHRGFETVTVAFSGEVEHQDSTGNKGMIGEGDVQWMTAGRGIIHEEYHSQRLTREGGTFEMCQLWVNLPKKYKMTKPGYQSILKDQIPVVSLVDSSKNSENTGSSVVATATNGTDSVVGTARIIAGELGDTKGAAKTFSPVQMWDVSLPKKDSVVDLPFPAHHNCIVFVRRGAVNVLSGDVVTTEQDKKSSLQQNTLGPQDVALMRLDGSSVLRLQVTEANSSVLILGGEPLDEPIAARGPFVMNTQQELQQAMRDFQSGKFGR